MSNLERGIQIVVRNGKAYLRAEPETAKYPTKNQIKSRIVFGEIAKQAKGQKFKIGNKFVREMPPAAEMVKEKMTGMEIGRTRKLKKWEEILLNYGAKAHQYEKILRLIEVRR